MAADPEVRLRADARRNRDQIIAAAREAFAAHGPEHPMEDIARRAGVGVGTLYRRFPDRDALIRAVAVDNFDRVLADVDAALEEEPEAWQVLVRMLHHTQELMLGVQLTMLSPLTLAALRDDPKIRELRNAIMARLDRVVRAAQAEGTLRADVGAGDIAMLFSALIRPVPASWAEVRERAGARLIAIMLDGLRAGPGDRLPGRPLTVDDTRV